MKPKDRIVELREAHQNVDKELSKATKNYGSWELVTKLKKQKLKLKDEIKKLEQTTTT